MLVITGGSHHQIYLAQLSSFTDLNSSAIKGHDFPTKKYKHHAWSGDFQAYDIQNGPPPFGAAAGHSQFVLVVQRGRKWRPRSQLRWSRWEKSWEKKSVPKVENLPSIIVINTD